MAKEPIRYTCCNCKREMSEAEPRTLRPYPDAPKNFRRAGFWCDPCTKADREKRAAATT